MRRVKPIHAAVGLTILAAAVLAPPPGLAADPRVLASSCSGCHTSSEKLTTAIPRIQGLPETVIVEAMRAFRTGQRASTVMERIAKGFTDDEIQQLAAYFGARK